MELEPAISLVVNGAKLTPHQLEVIQNIYETGSQKAAAQRLGIATPVLHRYLRQIEAKIGQALVETNSRGTILNADGEAIALEFIALKNRLRTRRAIVIGGTIVTEDLIMAALSAMKDPERYELIISNDERNMQDFRARLMDVVVLDDPIYAYETPGAMWDEVAEDRMLHIERSPAYGRFRFGAQRIGFKHLEVNQVEHHIDRLEHSIGALLRSNLSFFINESLAMRKGLNLRSATDPELLRHKILALYSQEGPEVLAIVNEMAKRSWGN
jgi:DNA-binding transcriptional LysR family regulator